MKKNNIDLRITFCLTFFLIISLISIYSAQNITNNLENIVIKQFIFYIIGIGVLFISYKFKNEIVKYSGLIYLGINFLLLILLFLGVSINGSKCWLMIGPFSFQPSEFMKIMLIIMLAKILTKKKKNASLKNEFLILIKCFIIVIIPSILTFLEPDTGVVIIYFIITFSMILYYGINKKWYIFLFVLLTLIGILITFLYFFKNELLINILGNNIFYRLDRLLNWSKGSGYQLENSLITISSSGIFGFGFNNVPLYFPEASTDFIFTTFSANFGFFGNIILLFAIIFFDSNILFITKKNLKRLDKNILIGVFVMILYQQFQNISMTIGLLPITGITLPFISYGGSSLLSYMFISGIILRIYSDSTKFLN